MNRRETEGIISIGIFISDLKMFDSFSRQKVDFWFSLINSGLDIGLKSLFPFISLDISLYFYIYIYQFLF